MVMINSISSGNGSNQWEGCDITYSLIQGGYDGEGNLNDDPSFENPGAGNYRLSSESPCIDVGHPDAQYFDENGTRNDMGYLGGPNGESYTYQDPVRRRIYVDVDNTSGNEEGTEQYPFDHIQEGGVYDVNDNPGPLHDSIRRLNRDFGHQKVPAYCTG